MIEEFLKEKNIRHENEDPKILDSLSAVFDLRNWNLTAFDPKINGNKRE